MKKVIQNHEFEVFTTIGQEGRLRFLKDEPFCICRITVTGRVRICTIHLRDQTAFDETTKLKVKGTQPVGYVNHSFCPEVYVFLPKTDMVQCFCGYINLL